MFQKSKIQNPQNPKSKIPKAKIQNPQSKIPKFQNPNFAHKDLLHNVPKIQNPKSPKSKIQNPKSQNPKSTIQNPQIPKSPKSQNPKTPKSQNPKSPKSKILYPQLPKSKFQKPRQIPKYGALGPHIKNCYITIQNPKSKIPKIQNLKSPKSKIQNPQNPKSKILRRNPLGNLVTVPGGQRLESPLVCLWGPLQNQLYLIELGQGSKLNIFAEVRTLQNHRKTLTSNPEVRTLQNHRKT